MAAGWTGVAAGRTGVAAGQNAVALLALFGKTCKKWVEIRDFSSLLKPRASEIEGRQCLAGGVVETGT